MNPQDQLYTLGAWTVKAGRESSFIAEWESFAKWTAKTQPGAGKAYLLRDADHPQQFTSFGPWENAGFVKTWRERPEFKAFVGRVRGLCDDFQPKTLTVVATSAD